MKSEKYTEVNEYLLKCQWGWAREIDRTNPKLVTHPKMWLTQSLILDTTWSLEQHCEQPVNTELGITPEHNIRCIPKSTTSLHTQNKWQWYIPGGGQMVECLSRLHTQSQHGPIYQLGSCFWDLRHQVGISTGRKHATNSWQPLSDKHHNQVWDSRTSQQCWKQKEEKRRG